MKIAIPAETDPGEPRVAATPETIKKFVSFGAEVAVEPGAFFAHELRKHHLVDLVGAIDETGRAGRAIDPLHDGVLGIAARALQLDRDVGGYRE